MILAPREMRAERWGWTASTQIVGLKVTPSSDRLAIYIDAAGIDDAVGHAGLALSTDGDNRLDDAHCYLHLLAGAVKGMVSFGKHDPPKPGPARR